MSDENEVGDLSAFIAARMAAEDEGDQGEDGGQEEEGQEELQAGAPDDTDDTVDDEDTGDDGQDDQGDDDGGQEDDRPAPGQERLSRVVQKLTRTERELAAARKEIRELRESAKAPRTRDTADRVEFVRQSLAEALGVDPTDARVNEELGEMFEDLAIELAGDSVNNDGPLRERRERRREEARKRQKDRELTDRLDRLEREKLELAAQNYRSQGVALIAGHLATVPDRFGFLKAQDEGDPNEMVFEVVQAWRAQGSVPRTEKEAVELVELAASRLDEVYRQKAGRYAGLLGQKNVETPIGKQEPKPKKKRGYTATDKAASGKNRTAATRQDDDEDFSSFVARRAREDRRR